MKVSNCRSCEAPIVWCVSDSGKNMPMDADSSEDGTFGIIERDGESPLTVFHKKLVAHGLEAEDVELHTSHHATCPDANKWRK